ncbi:MAG: glutathione S-transferase family protein, partial [Steroidobacteraceae bacterium]
MLEIFHREPNGFDLMPLITLFEKGVRFESRYIESGFEPFASPRPSLEAEENLEIEGPLLVHDGQPISEAFFMIEYLDETFPDPALKPRTPRGDWQVQVWGRFLGERAAPAVMTLGVHRFLAPALGSRAARLEPAVERLAKPERRTAWREALRDGFSPETLAESRRKAGLLVERVESALGERHSWLVEDTYGLADIAAFALSMSLPKLVPDLAGAAAAPRMTR